MIRRPKALLVLLTALNFVNYMDRFIMAAVLAKLIDPTAPDSLHLSKTEGGFLGTIFLLGFFITAPIFGSLGDRMSRKWLLATGAFLWSAATFASGSTSTALGLFAARALVGVGEASFTTLAPTLIDDVAPTDKKTSWQSIFQLAAPVGSALGFVAGGILSSRWGWRHAFWAGAGPGILLGTLCLFIAEPERTTKPIKTKLWKTARELFPLPLYRATVLGYTASTFCVGGFAHWAPSFLHVRYGLEDGRASVLFGAVTVVSGTVATLVGGKMGDRAQAAADAEIAKDGPPDDGTAFGPASPRDRARVRHLLRVCAIGSAVAAPAAFLCFFSPSPILFFVFAAIAEFGIFLPNGPVNLAAFRAMPPAVRASGFALMIFCIHFFGDLTSPTAIGKAASLLGDARIHWAMIPLPLALVLSAWFYAAPLRKGPAATGGPSDGASVAAEVPSND
jgi:MFS family permease